MASLNGILHAGKASLFWLRNPSLPVMRCEPFWLAIWLCGLQPVLSGTTNTNQRFESTPSPPLFPLTKSPDWRTVDDKSDVRSMKWDTGGHSGTLTTSTMNAVCKENDQTIWKCKSTIPPVVQIAKPWLVAADRLDRPKTETRFIAELWYPFE